MRCYEFNLHPSCSRLWAGGGKSHLTLVNSGSAAQAELALEFWENLKQTKPV